MIEYFTKMNRSYQYNFSNTAAGKYDVCGRERKAKTMMAVLKDYFKSELCSFSLLNVGGSTGIIDNYIADYFHSVISIDIDEPAINKAKENYQKNNLEYQIGDALSLQFGNNTFNIVICSHTYEHVASPEIMLDEIYRVLVPGGVCYFAASNRLMWREPHYNLPLLSVVPRPISHLYLKLTRKADHYHELHYTYWGLKALIKKFIVYDYTQKLICDPNKYCVGYMLPPGSLKTKIARLITLKFIWLSPGYIWLLKKPGN